nr:zinc finger, CCHC-type [Tanacetum cinerariifolium]
MEYMMKNVFGLRWNCRELKGIVKLRFFRSVMMIQRRLEDKKPEEKRNKLLRSRKSNIRLGGRLRRIMFLILVIRENTTMSTYLVNKVTIISDWIYEACRYVIFFCWLASIKQGMLEPVKVMCIFLGYRKGIIGKLWRLDDVTSKIVHYRNMGFNESRKYKKTFIGSGVGTGLVQVLQGVEFEVEPQEDHTFEVVPHGNVDHVVGSQEKAGLKDDMDARSNVYVLSNGCKKCSVDNDVYYWEYITGSLKANLQHIKALSTTEAGYMTFTEAWKKKIWLKGLLT